MVGKIGMAQGCGGLASDGRHSNSTESPILMRTVVTSYARKLFTLGSALALGFPLLLAAATSHAAPVLTNAQLRLQINVLDPILISQNPPLITPTVSQSGNALAGVQFSTKILSTSQFVIAVTDPSAAPIRGIQATAENGAANFVSTTMGGFGGQMPLIGVNKVCLFGACSAAVANLEVPIGVVGGPGATTVVTGAVNLTVIGAPWTSMTVAIGTATRMGGLTTMGTGTAAVYNVSLVTPVFVSTNIGASAVVPVFGYLDYTIPEPGTMAAFGAAIAALVSVGISRRRKS